MNETYTISSIESSKMTIEHARKMDLVCDGSTRTECLADTIHKKVSYPTKEYLSFYEISSSNKPGSDRRAPMK